jgi:hypothetical protein
MNSENTVLDIHGNKVGVVVREGNEWAAYSLSDLEVYRGRDYLLACWTLQGDA